MSLPDDIHLNSSLRLERISSEHVRDFMEIYLDKENVQYMDDVIKSCVREGFCLFCLC